MRTILIGHTCVLIGGLVWSMSAASCSALAVADSGAVLAPFVNDDTLAAVNVDVG